MRRQRVYFALVLGTAGLIWLGERLVAYLTATIAGDVGAPVWVAPALLWAGRTVLLAVALTYAWIVGGIRNRDEPGVRRTVHAAALWQAVADVSRSTLQLEAWDVLLEHTCEALMTVPDYCAVGVAVLDRAGAVATLIEQGFGDRFAAVVAGVVRGRSLGRGDSPPPEVMAAQAEIDPAGGGTTVVRLPSPEAGDRVGLAAPLEARDGSPLAYLVVETLMSEAAAAEDQDPIDVLVDDLAAALSALFNLDEQRRTVAALRNSELRYRRIFEDAPVGIFEATLDGELVNMNQSMADMLACASPSEALGFFSEFTTWLFGRSLRHKPFVAQLARDGEVRDYEFRTYRADGSDLWILLNARLIRRVPAGGAREGAGHPVVHGFVRDETERRRAEAALRESQRVLSTLMSNLPGMAYRCRNDERWTMLFVSEGCRELTGYSPAEILRNEAVSYADLVLPGDRARVWTTVQFAVQQGHAYEVEYRIRAKDGALKWVWEQGREVIAPGEADMLLEGLIMDISAAKQAEAEREALLSQVQQQAADLWAQAARLEMQTAQLEQIMATVPEGVLLLDADMRVVEANPAARQELAVLADLGDADRVKGRRLGRLGDRSIEDLLAPGPRQGLWKEIRTETRVFEALAKPVVTGPLAEGWVVVISDVTEERSVLLRVQQQHRLAAVGQLASGIAHDFNNILAVIVLYSQMALQLPEVSPKLRDQLSTIAQEADHASELIEQILDFGRQSELAPRGMDLVPFLKEQVRLLERIFPESIRIELAYDVGHHLVTADPSRLGQVVMNLAVNARDAMPEGGVLTFDLAHIEKDDAGVPAWPELQPGPWVRLSVRDTGSGIEPDVLPHIFEPFYSTKGRRGSGLGLSQVHGIVAQHGGAVDVRTKPGEGTAFDVYLPAPAEDPDATTSAHEPGPGQLRMRRGRGERVLVVEDNPALRRTLVDALSEHGYGVVEARHGEEALRQLEGPAGGVAARRGEDRAGGIALVLTDLVMPTMGGQALFRALQARGSCVPVVIMSGHRPEGDQVELEAEGLAGWVTKPVDLDHLVGLVADLLGRGQA